MDSQTTIIGLVLALTLYLVIHGTITWRRGSKNYREHLEPVLQRYGLTYVSEAWSGFFRIGPFPKFSIELEIVRTRVGSVRGEYSVYKIVTCRDETGKIHELWALLDFEMFSFGGVRWRSENSQTLPENAMALLER